MSGGGKKHVDIFISNQEKLGGGIEEEQDILDTDVDIQMMRCLKI